MSDFELTQAVRMIIRTQFQGVSTEILEDFEKQLKKELAHRKNGSTGMRVIEPGNPNKGWAGTFKCTASGNGGGGCGAILHVTEDDLFQTGNHSYDGSSEYYTTFRCCECGVWTDPPSKELPSRLQDGYRLTPARSWHKTRDLPLPRNYQ